MSPRRRRRRGSPAGDRTGDPVSEGGAGGGGVERTETGPDGDWVVRLVTGSAATKAYRCPGCDHEIRPATPHLVVWPAGGGPGLAERRHWHRACWQARSRRRIRG